MEDDLKKRIEKLESEVEKLKTRRISQADVIPDSIKERHVGEGVRFIRTGVTADLPTAGEEPMQGAAIFYDQTTKKLYIWNRTNQAWEYEEFS